jgi:hypothetical protein
MVSLSKPLNAHANRSGASGFKRSREELPRRETGITAPSHYGTA